jgi:hypothetical protein
MPGPALQATGETISNGAGTLQTLFHRFLSIAIAIFVVPLVALITALGSFAAPDANVTALQEGLWTLQGATRTTHAPRFSELASDVYSRVSGVAPDRVRAVLEASHAAGTAPTVHTSAQLDSLSVARTAAALHPKLERGAVSDISSDGRDRMSDILRVLDRQLDNAISGAQGSALRAIPPLATPDAEEAKQARDLSIEAVQLVHQVLTCAHRAQLQRAHSQHVAGITRPISCAWPLERMSHMRHVAGGHDGTYCLPWME